MEPYHRIVIEAEKFSPKFASRGSNKQWTIYTCRSKNMQNGRWSVDIVLRTNLVQVFFGMLALPKNRGACVDTQNWHIHKIRIGYINTNSNL